MSKPNKIAIFSGELPSSTFIEQLIQGVSKAQRVILFGVIKRDISYNSKQIRIYKTPRSHWINLWFTLYRSLLLFVKCPGDIIQLFKEVRRYQTLYERWTWFGKFLPIILYRPDVFHIQWARDLEFYAFLKTTFKIPMVVSLRGAHVNYTPVVAPYIAEVYRTTFSDIDGFHAVSESMAKAAISFGADASKIKVIHSPIQASLLAKYEVYKCSNSKSFRIGMVGRFHWIKGMRYVFDACAILKAQDFGYDLTIISTNVIDEASLFQIDQLEIKDHVQILPVLNHHELFEVMKSFDVLLLSSLNEGIANVVLEAMALGIPVISTDCGGMAEVVIPGETGWLVPVRDPVAIANAIIEVSQTPETELQRITQNAHDFVRAHFNAEDSINQFLELYRKVMMDL